LQMNSKITSPNMNVQRENMLQMLHKLTPSKNGFLDVPNYAFGDLVKGFLCLSCDNHMKRFNQKEMACISCGNSEMISSVVIREAVELNKLFPELKITTKLLYIWGDRTLSTKVIRKVLNQFLKIHGHKKGRFYT